jgi:hypothetical protein
MLGIPNGAQAPGAARFMTKSNYVDRFTVYLVFVSSALIAVGRVDGIGYTFTKIAHTSDGFVDESSDNFSAWTGFSINDSGEVAFAADNGSGRKIFIGNGVGTSELTSGGPGLNYFESPRINASGKVAFVGGLDLTATGIYVADGNMVTTIGTKTGVGIPSINDAGVVAFLGDAPSGGSAKAVYVGSGGPLVVLADGTGQPNASDFVSPVINNNGLVVYRSPLGIAVHDGLSETLIAPYSGPFQSAGNLDISDSGVIVFEGSINLGLAQGIYILTQFGFDVVADTNDGFTNIGAPSINNAGQVVFLASGGIFTGPDHQQDKVIASGDPLFGSTVQGVGFSSGTLNNSGQIVFFATLANGSRGIFRADPVIVPEPNPVLVCTQVVAAVIALRRIRRCERSRLLAA